jgi:chromosome segregation ATPase
MDRSGRGLSFYDMDDETRAAFARMDRWFELSQAQHQDLRQEMERQHQDLRQEMERQHQELRQQISRLDAGLTALYAEFRAFRDWVALQFADLRGVIQELTLRVERLERRQNDPIG